MMKLRRDVLLVFTTAVIVLLIKPISAIGYQDTLNDHSANLISLSKMIQVDRSGNLIIRSKGKIIIDASNYIEIKSSGNRVTLNPASIQITSNGTLTLASGSVTNIKGALIKIGGGNKQAHVVTTRSNIICPPNPGVPCAVTPGSASVLISN